MVFREMVEGFVRRAALDVVARHQAQPAPPLNHTPTTDIFGANQHKVRQNDAARYFECSLCGRKVAGARFAQHISKCLERKRR